eukprot:SAG31_NODE_21945_length_537_cov_1.059361_1_plen_82_part_00
MPSIIDILIEFLSFSFLERAQVDSGFWKGAAYLGAASVFGVLTPHSWQASIFTTTVGVFRGLGLDPALISDRKLMEDFFQR